MAASKLKKLVSMGLVCLMLTPVVSFATNGSAENNVEAEETKDTQTENTGSAQTGTIGTGGQTNSEGIVKNPTGVGFIDKINPTSLKVTGLEQSKVDYALNYLVASTADRRKMAFENASVEPTADASVETDKFDSGKVIDEHVFVTESEDYELYLKESNLSIIVRDKKTGTLLRSTLEDEEAYVRSSQEPTFNLLTSGITIVPVKYDPNVDSRSGMYDKSNAQVSSRDASITYDKVENGFVAHLHFDNHKNDLALNGLNIQFDVEVILNEQGLQVSIPRDSINENYLEDDLCYMMGDVYLFPLLGYTDRGDTEGYMILPDGNGIIVEFQDFYQDGTAKYKSEYQARVYGDDVSFDNARVADEGQERQDFNEKEKVIAPYFGMVHDYSSLNNGSHEKDMAVLGFVTEGEYNCLMKANFNGYNSIFENFTYASAVYRAVYDQPMDNASAASKTEVTPILMDDLEINYLITSGEEANYSGLANKTRDLLLEKGILHEQEKTNYEVRVDFLGLDKENFLLFRRNVVATTIANMEDIISQLQKNGVEDIAAFYDGWQDGGMYNLPNTEVKVDGDLGGNSGLKDLIDKYKDSSVSISLLQDMLNINDTTSNSTFTAMKLANKRTYSYTDRFLNVYKTFKYLTPSKTNEYIKAFADNAKEEGIEDVAFSGFTDTLSTYSLHSKIHSRKDAVDYYTSALEEVTKDGLNVTLENPSMYLWKYTDKYLDMPISSSMYVFTSEEIPFLSNVLKGSINLYSEYVNFEANQTEFFLKMVETGVNPSFLLTYESPTILQYTNSSWNYSSAYEQYIEVIAEFNTSLKEVNEMTEGEYIVNHEIDYDGKDDLTKVTYSNGVVVYVNYSEQAVSADGVAIDGLSYQIKAGE